MRRLYRQSPRKANVSKRERNKTYNPQFSALRPMQRALSEERRSVRARLKFPFLPRRITISESLLFFRYVVSLPRKFRTESFAFRFFQLFFQGPLTQPWFLSLIVFLSFLNHSMIFSAILNFALLLRELFFCSSASAVSGLRPISSIS